MPNDFARRIISHSSTIIVTSFLGAVVLFGLTAGLAEQGDFLS